MKMNTIFGNLSIFFVASFGIVALCFSCGPTLDKANYNSEKTAESVQTQAPAAKIFCSDRLKQEAAVAADQLPHEYTEYKSLEECNRYCSSMPTCTCTEGPCPK